MTAENFYLQQYVPKDERTGLALGSAGVIGGQKETKNAAVAALSFMSYLAVAPFLGLDGFGLANVNIVLLVIWLRGITAQSER
jgi:hypothetical protein